MSAAVLHMPLDLDEVCATTVHEAIKRSDARWLNETAFLGVMSDGEGGTLELRNCRCNSTLARAVVVVVALVLVRQ